MDSAEEVIVVTDSGKLGHAALARLCPLEEIDHLVVDGGISHEWRDRIESLECPRQLWSRIRLRTW
ncbi:MAG: hypothetical protein CM1200mP2_21010 [Planctomycetaceae bacterium]|nr:MAG: hypothetical protein CM1200mP2_21010 [Planctomycetaceae bacterium]